MLLSGATRAARFGGKNQIVISNSQEYKEHQVCCAYYIKLHEIIIIILLYRKLKFSEKKNSGGL